MNRRKWEDRIWESELDPLAKLVALAVASYADKDGRCWPSHAAVATRCSMHRVTVQRIITRRLVAGGWLRAEQRHSSHGKRSLLYHLMLPTRLDVRQDDYDPDANLWGSLSVVKMVD